MFFSVTILLCVVTAYKQSKPSTVLKGYDFREEIWISIWKLKWFGVLGMMWDCPPPALLPTPPHPLALGSSEKYSLLLLLSKTVRFTELCYISDFLNIFYYVQFKNIWTVWPPSNFLNFFLAETKNKGVHAWYGGVHFVFRSALCDYGSLYQKKAVFIQYKNA